MKRLVVVLDFDGTVTEKDIGDEVCDRFAPPAWRAIDDEWVRGEISLPEAQRRMWAMARASREAAIAYAREIGALRSGLLNFLDQVNHKLGALWLASGGFDFYIEALLAAHLDRFTKRFHNTTQFTDDERVHVFFPNDDLACGRCAVCKGKVCDLARHDADEVWFIGDGASDRCAIGRADRIFAVRGGHLERALKERDVAYTPFDSFDEITF